MLVMTMVNIKAINSMFFAPRFYFVLMLLQYWYWKTHLKIFQIYANNEDHHVLILNLIGFWFGVIFRM